MFSAFEVTAQKWSSLLAEAAGYIEKGLSLRLLPGRIAEILEADGGD